MENSNLFMSMPRVFLYVDFVFKDFWDINLVIKKGTFQSSEVTFTQYESRSPFVDFLPSCQYFGFKPNDQAKSSLETLYFQGLELHFSPASGS